MKHISVLIIALFATLAVHSQEIAVEQVIHRPFTDLDVQGGWDLHIIHTPDTQVTISIVTTEANEMQATQTQLCGFKTKTKRSTLQINANSTLPAGTRVELRGNLNLKEITLNTNARVTVDHLQNTSLTFKDNATLSIGCYSDNSVNDCSYNRIDVTNFSSLHIDTIKNVNLHVELNQNSRFTFSQIEPSAQLSIDDENGTSVNDYSLWQLTPDPKHKHILEDTIRNISVHNQSLRKWNHFIMLNGGFNENTSLTGNYASPYATTTSGDIWIEFFTGFKLSNKWSFSVGLNVQSRFTQFDHQVELGTNGLTLADTKLPATKNYINNGWLSIPFRFWYGVGKDYAISPDIQFGRLFLSTFYTQELTTEHKSYKTEADFVNPWRIELGLSLRINKVFFKGVRIYTNLLPEYRANTTGKNIHAFGLQLLL